MAREKIYEIPVEDQTSSFAVFERQRLVRASSVIGIDQDLRAANRCLVHMAGGVTWKVLMSARDLAELLMLHIVRRGGDGGVDDAAGAGPGQRAA